MIKFEQDLRKLSAWILQTCRKSTFVDRVEFTGTFFKLSDNTRRTFTKLFKELVSHCFSYLITL